MKALYLDGCRGLDVRLDGPALRVRRPGRADAHYPLPRIARVIAMGRVYWQPDALAACLTEHKPVTVLDSQGRFVRVLFRPPGSQYGLARHLGELLAVPRFRVRYERWLCAAEQAEMTAAVGRLDIRCQDLQPDHTWQIVCREHAPALAHPRERLLPLSARPRRGADRVGFVTDRSAPRPAKLGPAGVPAVFRHGTA